MVQHSCRIKRENPYNASSLSLPTFNCNLEGVENILAARLSEAVLESELMIKIPSLYAFTEEYIIPVMSKFPCARNLDLSCLVGDDVFRRGFESSYDSIFVNGCHTPSIPRAAGITAFPETKHQIMFRNLIKDLWEILGSLFLMPSYLFRLFTTF